MNDQNATTTSVNHNVQQRPGKEEILAAIRETAARLGYAPNYPELRAATGIARQWINRYFANYTRALQACGLERGGAGYEARLEALYLDFAGIVRRLGAVPTSAEYEIHSQFTSRPLTRRFGKWRKVAEGLLRFGEQDSMKEGWEDVLEIMKNYCRAQAEKNRSRESFRVSAPKSRILPDRPVYGASIVRQVMAHAPTNEMGVVYLFGALALKLGFCVLWLGTEYPDGEVLREVEPDRWQRVRIEFEFESRNFLHHRHDPAGCDLVVCWENNWPECPLEVLELKGSMDLAADLRR